MKSAVFVVEHISALLPNVTCHVLSLELLCILKAPSILRLYRRRTVLQYESKCVRGTLQESDTAVVDWWERSPEQWQAGELLLACGATAVADLRAAVAAELGYSCSAGIAHNKVCS